MFRPGKKGGNFKTWWNKEAKGSDWYKTVPVNQEEEILWWLGD